MNKFFLIYNSNVLKIYINSKSIINFDDKNWEKIYNAIFMNEKLQYLIYNGIKKTRVCPSFLTDDKISKHQRNSYFFYICFFSTYIFRIFWL